MRVDCQKSFFLLFSDYTAVVHPDRMSNSSASSSFLNKLGKPIFVYLRRKVSNEKDRFRMTGFSIRDQLPECFDVRVFAVGIVCGNPWKEFVRC